MRDMNDDERKVFAEKMDYIGKLRDSMTQEEMDGLLPKEVTERLDAPKFDFGDARFYPREEFNEYLASAYTGSPVSETLKELRRRVGELEMELDTTRTETNGYVAEIERLEKELEDAKAALFKAENRTQPEEESAEPVGLKVKTFFPGEINAFTFCMVSDWMRNRRPQVPSECVRAYEIAKMYREKMLEYVDVKEDEKAAKEFREKLEKAVDEAFSSTPTDISPLLSIGFTNRTRKNSPHYKVAWLDRDEYTFVIAKTPSDRNGVENCKRNIVSRLCI